MVFKKGAQITRQAPHVRNNLGNWASRSSVVLRKLGAPVSSLIRIEV